MNDQHAIGIDLGGTKIAAGLVDRSGAVGRAVRYSTETGSQDALVAQIEAVIDELLDGTVQAACVGIPSLIDQRAGRAGASVNVPLADVALRDRLETRFGIRVVLENDATAAEAVLLTLGTGIGGGLILNGGLYRGAVGAAGELGHLTIDLDGPECQGLCPGYGHLEALASGTAAGRLADEAAASRSDGSLARALAEGRDVDPPLLVELGEAGEADALEVLEVLGYRLGVGIAGYVNVFNPEVVVVGGGFARAGDLILEPARRVVAEQALPLARDVVRIVLAELGPDAGLIGAGLVALDALGDGSRS